MASNKFISRGGDKLQAAIENFKLKIKDLIVLDVGSSTGGFVDCLIQNGAKKVYAVDTAYGELAWKLRKDPRGEVMERTNILHLTHLPGVQHLRGEAKESLGSHLGGETGEEKVDLITIDAGWTKLELILPVVKKFLKQKGIIIALLKPQYEAERKPPIKGVLSEDVAEEIKNEVIKKIYDLGFKIKDQMVSPILGGEGNTEYLLLLKKS